MAVYRFYPTTSHWCRSIGSETTDASFSQYRLIVRGPRPAGRQPSLVSKPSTSAYQERIKETPR